MSYAIGRDRLYSYRPPRTRGRKRNWIPVHKLKISRLEITGKAGIDRALPTATIEGKVEFKPTKKQRR